MVRSIHNYDAVHTIIRVMNNPHPEVLGKTFYNIHKVYTNLLLLVNYISEIIVQYAPSY